MFDESNEFVSTVEIRDIEWVHVLDMDKDGVAELITQELGAYGTGVIGKDFCIYRVDGKKIVRIWSRRAVSDQRSAAMKRTVTSASTPDTCTTKASTHFELREGRVRRRQ